jgi:O-methyltransferase
VSTEQKSARALYLDLLKRSLTNWIYGQDEIEYESPRRIVERLTWPLVLGRDRRVVKRKPFDPEQRRDGRDWPSTAHTMIGLKRLDNLQHCIEQVITDKVPGDFIETGVWRGGSTIFMRGALEVYGERDRTVWVADSFEGLPPPNPSMYPADEGDLHHTLGFLQVSMEQVKQNFDAYGLLDEQVRFLKGWFRDTLPTAPIERLAILRLDGDMYESTMDALTSLYPKLSPGGFIIVDDYVITSCAAAIADYRTEHGIEEPILPIDGTGVYWRKAGARPNS